MAGASGRVLFTLSSSISSGLSRHTKQRFPFPTLSNPLTFFPRFRPLCSITATPETLDSDNAKHSMLFERLRIRHLKDTAKTPKTNNTQNKGSAESEMAKKKKVVNFGNFEELGLSDEVMDEMGLILEI